MTNNEYSSIGHHEKNSAPVDVELNEAFKEFFPGRTGITVGRSGYNEAGERDPEAKLESGWEVTNTYRVATGESSVIGVEVAKRGHDDKIAMSKRYRIDDIRRLNPAVEESTLDLDIVSLEKPEAVVVGLGEGALKLSVSEAQTDPHSKEAVVNDDILVSEVEKFLRLSGDETAYPGIVRSLEGFVYGGQPLSHDTLEQLQAYVESLGMLLKKPRSEYPNSTQLVSNFDSAMQAIHAANENPQGGIAQDGISRLYQYLKISRQELDAAAKK